MNRIIVIGGGAAGFMSAIECGNNLGKKFEILILERGKQVLEKVRISGGGRCNVTNGIKDPKELVKNYPRGERELLGPFMQFNCEDTVEWFRKKGVKLKVEADGRMFPTTDNSETIVNCLMQQAHIHQIKIMTSTRIDNFYYKNNRWVIEANGKRMEANYLICTPGSSNAVWEILKKMGHTVISPVPSLFTFNIQHPVLQGLMGVSHSKVELNCKDLKLKSVGPLLITHWGLSGPAVLKLSAWGARKFNEVGYQFEIGINWTGLVKMNEVENAILEQKATTSKQKVTNTPLFDLSSRLWTSICNYCGIEDEKWADLSKAKIQNLTQNLFVCNMKVKGKSTFKEEFVTAGGVALKEINMKTMESKLFPNLYLAGEIIDIDAITGGFNFQAAWTGGWLIGKAIGEKENY